MVKFLFRHFLIASGTAMNQYLLRPAQNKLSSSSESLGIYLLQFAFWYSFENQVSPWCPEQILTRDFPFPFPIKDDSLRRPSLFLSVPMVYANSEDMPFQTLHFLASS